MKFLLATCLASIACLIAAPAALAAPPANDNREAAELVTVPQNVTGSTVDATTAGDPASECTGGKNSVWYRIVGTGKRVAIGLEADGDLDALIDVFNYSRSEPTGVDCEETDKRGLAVVGFRAKAGVTYFVRVSERLQSVSGTFTMKVLQGSEPASKPGKRLPRKGVSDTVNLASNPSDTWSMTMHSGTPYLIQLSTSDANGCASATLYGPGESLDDEGSDSISCNDGFTVFTPDAGEGGRYTIAVYSSVRTLATQKYRLRAGAARKDDIAPGAYWPKSVKRGHLSGDGIDIRDLYNFDLDRNAVVSLRLSSEADFYVRLRSVGGRSLACTCNGEINKRLPPGTYFAEVRATPGQNGRYTLRRTFRTITHTTTTFNGAHHALAGDGQSVSISGLVSPAGRGRVEITLERKDPAFGWMFVKRWKGGGAGGGRTVSWTPPGVGEYRAKTVFSGSRYVNPSRSGWARLSVRR